MWWKVSSWQIWQWRGKPARSEPGRWHGESGRSEFDRWRADRWRAESAHSGVFGCGSELARGVDSGHGGGESGLGVFGRWRGGLGRSGVSGRGGELARGVFGRVLAKSVGLQSESRSQHCYVMSRHSAVPKIAALAATFLLLGGCGDTTDSTSPGGNSESSAADSSAESSDANIVATTSIWADVVSNLACGTAVEITTLVPAGVDPHSYEPSLADRARLEEADLIVANGLGLEEGLEVTIHAAEDAGTPVFHVAEHISVIPYPDGEDSHAEDDHHDEGDHDEDSHDEGDHDEDGHDEDGHEDGDHDEGDHDEDGHEEGDHDEDGHDEDGHDEGDHDEDGHEDGDHDDGDHDEDGHDEDGHGKDDHEDDGHDEGEHDEDDHDDGDHHEEDHAEDHHAGEDEHTHSGGDPHVWLDPVRVSEVLEELAKSLVDNAGLDMAVTDACVTDYQNELSETHQEIDVVLEAVPVDRRKLVTNHHSMGYFADRYNFEVIGTVLPTPSGLAQTTPGGLSRLLDVIAEEGVPAIFAEAQHSTDDIDALAASLDQVEVVTLYTGALTEQGTETDTYIKLLETNARLIANALG